MNSPKAVLQLLLILSGGIFAGQATAATADIRVDVAAKGARVPDTFYGLMTEEINYSYDGGLFGELIQNRTFQDPVPGVDPRRSASGAPRHWTPVGGAALSTNRIQPLTTALPVNLRLSLEGGSGAVENDGYWGIPVRPNVRYAVSFYARSLDGFNADLEVSLRLRNGDRVVAKKRTSPVTGAWNRFKLELETPADCPVTADAVFALGAKGNGTVDFSLVSLMPADEHGEPVVLRKDLMKLLADMAPAFIRLPGGNYVEGGRFADRFSWKRMIGKPEERPGHMGCWGYRSSDGFGLPEYLRWCKELRAEPVLALFAGYTLNGDYFAAGTPEMDLYTQEALDEIEYVMGPADSKWGSKRAQDGFPEPFSLRYVEIGNEDFFDRSGSYEGRFAQMAASIRQRFPSLKIIATMPVSSFKPDLVDDHLYDSPQGMLRQGTRYDVDSKHPEGRKPDGIKVFMGEWATQNGNPTPNLRAALSDAVFVMGLERNADAVPMQCYAPLFANVNHEDPAHGRPRGWQWGTNLIGYDALSSFGSPSYHVLSLFGKNRGDVNLSTTVETKEIEPVKEASTKGLVGVGTYNTGVEYEDMSVTDASGRPLSGKNLFDQPELWKFSNESWVHSQGGLRSKANNLQAWAMAGDVSWENYTVKVRARKTGGDEGFLLLWHSLNGDNLRWWNLGGWGNTTSRCEVTEDGARSAYGDGKPFYVEKDRWYDLRLEVTGKSAKGFVDGKLVMVSDNAEQLKVPTAFATSLWVEASHEVIVKVVNTGASPLDANIQITGVRSLKSGKVLELSGEPEAVNSLETPERVVPRETSLSLEAPSFVHRFPAHSVSLLRFPALP